MLTCIYSLKKVQEVEFLIFLKDIAKATINILNLAIQTENRNILYTERQIINMAMQCLIFFPKSGQKWIDPKEFDLSKYTSNSSKGYVLEVDLEYPKELQQLHNDYPLPSDKTEIKGEMLSEYQLKIAIYTIFLLKMSKNQCLTFFYKEKYALHYENLQL